MRHVKQKKAIEQHLIVNQIWQKIEGVPRPLIIKLTRIAPRMLDDEDNLPISFKSLKDYIANYLHPGLQIGWADGLEDFKWQYAQEKGAVREYAIRVEFYECN